MRQERKSKRERQQKGKSERFEVKERFDASLLSLSQGIKECG